jgi:hypothetical protein
MIGAMSTAPIKQRCAANEIKLAMLPIIARPATTSRAKRLFNADVRY